MRDALVRLRLVADVEDVPCVATAALQVDPHGVTVLPVGPDTSGLPLTLRGHDARRLRLGGDGRGGER